MNHLSSITIFKEVQRFKQVWFYILVFFTVVVVWAVFMPLVVNRRYVNGGLSFLFFIFFLLIFGVIFPLFMLSMKLIVSIKEDGVYYKFYPFHLRYRVIRFEDIEDYRVRNFSTFTYGGLGIRYGKGTVVYSMNPGKGVEFKLRDKERKVLIGIDHIDEFVNVLKERVPYCR